MAVYLFPLEEKIIVGPFFVYFLRAYFPKHGIFLSKNHVLYLKFYPEMIVFYLEMVVHLSLFG